LLKTEPILHSKIVLSGEGRYINKNNYTILFYKFGIVTNLIALFKNI